MRFRPVGEPIGEAEQATIERKRKMRNRPRPVHYSEHGSSGRAACVVAAAKTAGRRLYGWRRSKSWSTSIEENVTCARCKKLLAKSGANVVPLRQSEPTEN
jgi:hypothetical protein